MRYSVFISSAIIFLFLQCGRELEVETEESDVISTSEEKHENDDCRRRKAALEYRPEKGQPLLINSITFICNRPQQASDLYNKEKPEQNTGSYGEKTTRLTLTRNGAWLLNGNKMIYLFFSLPVESWQSLSDAEVKKAEQSVQAYLNQLLQKNNISLEGFP